MKRFLLVMLAIWLGVAAIAATVAAIKYDDVLNGVFAALFTLAARRSWRLASGAAEPAPIEEAGRPWEH